ncbi:MAG: hypothetical protein FWD53_10760 [Phycisphaerales bacterium]|nr:hypothetical protein [Phycisphaerales bacterium]
MDDLKLEALLMDRALGGMSPEVAGLLDAYLERDAESRGRAEAWENVAGLAKRAMREDRVAELPAFPRRRLEAVRWWGRLGRVAVWGGAMAACLAVGWFLGSHKPVAEVEVGNKVAAVENRQEPRVAAVKDFWSEERLRTVVMERRNSPSSQSPSMKTLYEKWLKQTRERS